MAVTLRRILLVDDCEDTLDLLRAALEEDYEIFGIEDPRQTQAAFDVFEPDVVILDLMMPEISGFDILERYKDKKGKSPPIVVLSCKSSADDQKRAYALGAGLYLTKPIEPDRLKRNLKLFIEGAKIVARPKQFNFSEATRMMEMRSQFTVSQLPIPEGPAPKPVEAEPEESEDEEDKGPEPRWLN